MYKSFFSVIALLSTLSAFSQTEFLVSVKAKTAFGGIYTSDNNDFYSKVKECHYYLKEDTHHSDHLRLYLNSDEEANTHFSLVIPKSELPLVEGAHFKTIDGHKVSYSNGILKAKRRKTDDLLFGDKALIILGISQDLMKIKHGQGLNTLHSLIKKRKFKEIKCQF